MAEKVGELYYDVSLDTAKMIRGQRDAEAALKKTTGALDSFNAKLSAVASAISIYAIAMAQIKAVQMADDIRLLSARVEVAAGSFESGSVAMGRLVAISRSTQTAVEANVQVFTRLNSSVLAMGGTQNDTLRITDLLAKAIKVSGASAVEAKSAMLQFGQALGSGKLAGDELRSLMENAPYLMKQLAAGLGVPIGALKEMGEKGKLTADVVTNALGKAAAQIESDFAKFPQTLGGAFDVVVDAAARANEKLDEVTGKSIVLTGAAKGLGEVLDKLADQFGAANTQAGNLGRNDAIKGWADRTRVALSYLVDAADLVWQTVSVLGRNVAFVFNGIGNEIGGIGAQINAVMHGDFAGARAIGEAMKADAEQRRKELDAEDAKTLSRTKLAGQQMREAWNAGAGGGRGFVNPAPAVSTLKPPPGTTEGKKKRAGAKFDEAGYLAELRKQQATEMGVINETETEKLRVAKKHLDEKQISEATYVQAVLAITEGAEKDRADLIRKTQEGIDRDRLEAERKAARDREELERNRLEARRDIAAADPIATVRLEEEQKIAVVEAARQLDLANTQLYEDQKTAIHQWAAEQRAAIVEHEAEKQRRVQEMEFSALSDLAGNIYGLLEKAGKERTALARAAFLAQKAVAVAEIIMNTEVAASKAGAQLGIFGLPMATVIRAAGYASAGLVAGMAIGEAAGSRRYGGPVSAGSLYQVNEAGRPEMFTAGNRQYMLPTRSGQVTPADAVAGGSVQWQIIINQNAPGAAATASVDQQARTVTIAVQEVANQISNNTGPVWTAMRGSTSVKGRM